MKTHCIEISDFLKEQRLDKEYEKEWEIEHMHRNYGPDVRIYNSLTLYTYTSKSLKNKFWKDFESKVPYQIQLQNELQLYEQEQVAKDVPNNFF